MKRCVFMTAKDATHGFNMAGFRQIITTANEVIEEFQKVIHGDEPGLVIIDERLLTERNFTRLHSIERRWKGAMVVLPAPSIDRERESEDYGNRLIARVLGYQMKLTS